jgi:RHH-type proline utilization regulon transcriptional repressor/proline dehydrogenase/delta 1-pyrroline-5-carboxylate dehydrogenase
MPAQSSPFANFAPPIRPQDKLRAAITSAYRRSEPDCVVPLANAARVAPAEKQAIAETARNLIAALRAKHRGTGVEGLVQEYALSSQEGVALMCLAEALLRIPDTATRDALIRDKIGDGDWQSSHWEAECLAVRQCRDMGPAVTGKLVAPVSDRGLGAALTGSSRAAASR